VWQSAGGARFPLAVLHPDVDEQRLILVVEDDEATRGFLLDNLAADGFRVAGASGAGAGLRAIEVRQPALGVLDIVSIQRSRAGLGPHADGWPRAPGVGAPGLPTQHAGGQWWRADSTRPFSPDR
jgi:hypothetical protein